MREYKKQCQICGKQFTTSGRCAKFCNDCKAVGYKMGKKKFTVKVSHDTEAMREACLSCTRPRCGGECERLAIIAKGGMA